MQGISDNYYLIDIGDTDSLIYTISDSEEFGFCGCDIYCLIDSLDYQAVVQMNK